MNANQEKVISVRINWRKVPKVVIALVIMHLVGGVVLGLWWWLPSGQPGNQSTESPPVNVTVEVIHSLRDVRDTFDLPGVVEPNRVVNVAAEVAGRIEKILCREGRACLKGDPMIELNADILGAEHDRTKAQSEFDQRAYERVKELLARGVATPNELDQARTKAAASRAAFVSARAMLERTRINAPISGILNRVPVEVGEYVRAGVEVAEIVDIDKAIVVVDVPERDIRFLSVGDEQRIDVGWAKGREIVGAITYIGELADDKTRTTRVEITVDNLPSPDRRRPLRSGQIVRASLTRRVLDNVVMIPLAAVIPLENGKAVYVVNDGEAKRRTVELGFFKGRRVQILSGLTDGDRLIVSGHRYVGPGQRVKEIDPPGPPAKAAQHPPVDKTNS